MRYVLIACLMPVNISIVLVLVRDLIKSGKQPVDVKKTILFVAIFLVLLAATWASWEFVR